MALCLDTMGRIVSSPRMRNAVTKNFSPRDSDPRTGAMANATSIQDGSFWKYSLADQHIRRIEDLNTDGIYAVSSSAVPEKTLRRAVSLQRDALNAGLVADGELRTSER